MKKILYFLGLLAVAVAAAFGANKLLGGFENPGYVLICIGQWSLETSLIVFAVSLIISFFVFYVFFRLLGWLFRLPGRIKNRGKDVKFNRSQEALIVGLPTCLNGESQYTTKASQNFAHSLEKRFHLPVHLVDERLSTVEARAQLFAEGGYRKIKSSEVDSIAACIILEQWLGQGSK